MLTYLAILVILFLTLLLIQTVSLLAEQKARISSLEKTVDTLLQKPNFYVQNYHHQGNIMPQEREINITPQGDAIGVVVGDSNNLEGVMTKTSGDIANITNDIAQAETPAVKPMRKALLSELEKTIEKDPQISPEQKANALDQVNALRMINPANSSDMETSTSDELLSDEP